MNAKNADRGIHKQYDCLGYEGDVLKFVAEADAPYWIFMPESEYVKPEPLEEGYSVLDGSLYHVWTGDAPGSTIVGNYDGTSGDDTFYGDGNLVIEHYADLTDYDKLIITVTSATPRLFFNKVDGGKYNASDENGSGRIEISTAGGWAEKYFTVVDGVWTIDLAAIRADKGYVHLNAIKGPAYGQSVGISSMLLYKDPGTTGISHVHGGSQMATDDSLIYTISGQRVAAPQRGLNIINGKRVLIK